MRVSLRKEDETSGWFAKTTEYCLYVKVELSAEELHAIEAAGIGDIELMPYSYKGVDLNWKVSSVVYANKKGSEWRFVASNAIERNSMEQTVKGKLSALKEEITKQLVGGVGTESFDL